MNALILIRIWGIACARFCTEGFRTKDTIPKKSRVVKFNFFSGLINIIFVEDEERNGISA